MVGPELKIPKPIRTLCRKGLSVSVYSYIDTTTYSQADHIGIGAVIQILRRKRLSSSRLARSATLNSDLAFAKHWAPGPRGTFYQLLETKAFVAPFTRILNSYQPVLSHGDLNPSNVFVGVNAQGKSFAPIVLDWELGALAVPHRDAAIFTVQMGLGSPEINIPGFTYALLERASHKLGYPKAEMAAAIARELCFRNCYEGGRPAIYALDSSGQSIKCLAWLNECLAILNSA